MPEIDGPHFSFHASNLYLFKHSNQVLCCWHLPKALFSFLVWRVLWTPHRSREDGGAHGLPSAHQRQHCLDKPFLGSVLTFKIWVPWKKRGLEECFMWIKKMTFVAVCLTQPCEIREDNVDDSKRTRSSHFLCYVWNVDVPCIELLWIWERSPCCRIEGLVWSGRPCLLLLIEPHQPWNWGEFSQMENSGYKVRQYTQYVTANWLGRISCFECVPYKERWS